MKKLIISTALCGLLSGCYSTYPAYTAPDPIQTLYNNVSISPSISPDGKNTFQITAWNQMPSIHKPGETLAEAHARMISAQMGRQRLCLNGYELASKRVVDSNTFYEGVCK